MKTSLLILALLAAAVVIEASPTSIQAIDARGGAMGTGAGGHSGPAYEGREDAWKARIRTMGPSFESVAARGKFADRRLLARGGMMGRGDGGHSSPAYEAREDAWKARIRTMGPSFESVAARGKFADRRLLARGSAMGTAGGNEGRGGPAYEGHEDAWKERIRPSAVTFDTVSTHNSDKFVDRRLMQGVEEAGMPEWRNGMAGIKQQVRSAVVATTPLREDRYVKPQA